MARRRKRDYGIVSRDQRSALGATAVTAAVTRLTLLKDRMVKEFHPWPWSGQEVIEMCFPEEVRVHMARAFELAADQYTYHDYWIVAQRFKVHIPYQFWGAMLAINQEQFTPTVDMVQWYKDVAATLDDWAVAKHVLLWLDEHASTGAIRNYFPVVVSLLDPQDRDKLEANRFRDPDGLGPMLPLIRRASNVVASAHLLPETREREEHGMTVTFSTCNNAITGPGYSTDQYILRV